MDFEQVFGAQNDDGRMILDPFEIRVLAVLAEKEKLTPDAYPMSLNALANGCNQLSSRDPVMSISEQSVQEALVRLLQKKLVAEVSQAGARVAKFEHRMRIRWTLEQDKLAVLVLLMLRGSQTAGEIRARAARMHEFSDVAAVETALQFLIDKFPPLVLLLERAPGTKEARYVHTLIGEESARQQDIASVFSARVAAPVSSGMASGGDRIGQLENEVAELRSSLESLQLEFAQFRKQFE